MRKSVESRTSRTLSCSVFLVTGYIIYQVPSMWVLLSTIAVSIAALVPVVQRANDFIQRTSHYPGDII